MYLTKKKIEYADLVSPLMNCPFINVDNDCPFIEYWKLANIEEQVQIIEKYSEEQLNLLRLHHWRCVERKEKQRAFKIISAIGICFSKDLIFRRSKYFDLLKIKESNY